MILFLTHGVWTSKVPRSCSLAQLHHSHRQNDRGHAGVGGYGKDSIHCVGNFMLRGCVSMESLLRMRRDVLDYFHWTARALAEYHNP